MNKDMIHFCHKAHDEYGKDPEHHKEATAGTK